MNNNLTYNEIIEALGRCGYHQECCYCNSVEECGSKKVLVENTLDLINRLQVQNKDLAETVHNLTLEKDALFDKSEELKVEIERLKEFIVETRRCDKEIKAEAVKEFCEKRGIKYVEDDV